MYRTSFAFWYCVLVLAISFSGKSEEFWENFTNGDEWNDDPMMSSSYKLNANLMEDQANKTILIHYNLREKSVINESETNVTSHELNGNSQEDNVGHKSVDDNIVQYKMCKNTCMLHCCSLIRDNCDYDKINYSTKQSNFTLKDKIDYSCEENKLPFDIMDNENIMFFDNSSLNLSRRNRFIWLTLKCFYVVIYDDKNTCSAIVNQQISIFLIILTAVLITSLLCLLITFIVYSICPELQSMHGYALRSYVASLFFVYTIFLIIEKDFFEETYSVCVVETLLYSFCYLSSLLWQNVICIDILQTLGRFRLLRKSVKQSRRRMSLCYAWGISSIYIIICTMMNFIPNVPDNIRPNICINLKFGFESKANIAYFDIPVSVTIICNICFFIFTMINIIHATKKTDRFLKDVESKRHIDDKKRFMLYLKLFLLMDINSSLKWTSAIILQSLGQQMPSYVPFIMDVIESLQGLIVFIIFVCKKRIVQLLLKRFGFENSYLYNKMSTSTITSRTTSATEITIHAKNACNSNMQANCHVKNSSEVIESTTI